MAKSLSTFHFQKQSKKSHAIILTVMCLWVDYYSLPDNDFMYILAVTLELTKMYNKGQNDTQTFHGMSRDWLRKRVMIKKLT